MAYVADLHIHSRFARACSPVLNILNLLEWAKLKGINLLGTGDFLHPLWLTELKSQLKEDGSGFLYHNQSGIKFLLTVEIASIYTHKGKGRRIHSLVFMPNFEAVNKFQKSLLAKKANLSSDGRPIVGIPTKDLLYMALEASEKALFIPAHLWTPWFGTLGSKSGYNSLNDCFEDLTEKIYGIETGLSSDPLMNWRVEDLDTRSILSFSDAHSLPNLGREVTIFNGSLEDGYEGLWNAIKTQDLAGTVEFYPEEGKYHYTGHRSCGVKYALDEEKQKGTICPVCGRSLTIGVMSRVDQLATITEAEAKLQKSSHPSYQMLVPLQQVIAEAMKSTPTSQKVLSEYKKLAQTLGGEINVLTKANLSAISKLSGSKIAAGVDKNRNGQISVDPGFDGVYGKVKIWSNMTYENI